MNAEPLPDTAPRADLVPFRRALRAWFAISLQTFGGPAGQIAVMQGTLVDDRRWIGQKRFQHALKLLHSAARSRGAQQLAIYIAGCQARPSSPVSAVSAATAKAVLRRLINRGEQDPFGKRELRRFAHRPAIATASQPSNRRLG